MRRCPSDDTLLLAHYGEAETAVGEHIGACLRCAARARRLARDLASITGVLDREPHEPRRHRGSPASWPRLVAAAAVAGLILLGGAEVWMWRAATSLTRTSLDTDSVAAFGDVASALSSGSDGDLLLGLAADADGGLGDLDDLELEDDR